MKNRLFNEVRVKRPKRNVFDLSHERKMSLNMGKLVPCYLQEVVPGDTFRVNTEMLIRFAPLLAPVMHRINVYFHYFFVPNRLVWDNWQEFITGGVDGLQAPAHPVINVIPTNSQNGTDWHNFAKGSLADYFGLPICNGNIEQAFTINALPFRAYQLIWNEYYRDQNLMTAVAINKGNTVPVADVDALMYLQDRCWEKDYFTSALTTPQRGADVTLPVGFEPVEPTQVFDDEGSPLTGALSASAGQVMVGGADAGYVDVGDNLSITINDLRQASRLQEWLEKNARAGSRYIEQILSHFGVRSSDARLQRPEYLGGGKSPVIVSEVLQTVATEANTGGFDNPLGTMGGHAVSAGNTNQFKKFFEEHGFIIGIMSVLPRTAYQDGIPRVFNKSTKFDYYFPEFAHLGEQEVLQKELYFNPLDTAPDVAPGETFGYQSRYAEYKFNNSTVHGDFKDNLSFWHMGRMYSRSANSTQPVLNDEFVVANPTTRVFAVTTETLHHIYVQLYNNVKAIRPMPIFGTPRL